MKIRFILRLPLILDEVISCHLNDQYQQHGDEKISNTTDMGCLKEIGEHRISSDEHT